ncbi:hypothetical protein HUT18_07670 [Streptomyces sp. NA04227]|uniref:hypothetical protein n=1 Tax=Streptomyces sp. NA04227 TaxID=2742136 RepID=UPI0015903062|nr:hypothetical protein [Streptomyces sp. NA04227]QKW06299.1 hypothetical protein HUT18_07670 [Streptomyces sp. NA04227]
MSYWDAEGQQWVDRPPPGHAPGSVRGNGGAPGPPPDPRLAPGPNVQRRMVLSVVVVAALALVGVGIWLLVRAADGEDETTKPPWTVETPGTVGGPNSVGPDPGYSDGGVNGGADGGSSGGNSDEPTEPEPEPEEPEVPAGYRLVDDEAGYRLAVPEGWYRTTRDTSVYYAPEDPTTTRTSFLQIFELEGPEPTPYDSAVEAERLVSDLPDYTRLILEGEGGAYPYADLQYTYNNDEFGPRHVADHRFATPDGTMYAVVAAGPVDESGDQIEALRTALGFFCPQGAGCYASGSG